MTRRLVESHLVALARDDSTGSGTTAGSTTATSSTSTSTTVGESASSTTTSTTSASAVAEATTSTATSSTTTSTVTTESTTSATTTVVGLRSGVVNSDGSASKLVTLQSLKSGLGLALLGELNVTVTLWCSGVPVSGQSNGLDVSVVTEGLVDLVLVQAVRQTSNVEGVGNGGKGVTVSLGSLVSGGGSGTGLRVVDSNLSAVEVGAVLLNSGGGSLEGGEGNETESSGSVGVGVHHDLGGGDLTARLELGSQPVVIDVPRQLTNEDGQSRLVLAVVLGGLSLLGWGSLLLVGLSLACKSALESQGKRRSDEDFPNCGCTSPSQSDSSNRESDMRGQGYRDWNQKSRLTVGGSGGGLLLIIVRAVLVGALLLGLGSDSRGLFLVVGAILVRRVRLLGLSGGGGRGSGLSLFLVGRVRVRVAGVGLLSLKVSFVQNRHTTVSTYGGGGSWLSWLLVRG